MTIDSQDLVLDESEVFCALGYPHQAPEPIQVVILDMWQEALSHITGLCVYDHFPVRIDQRTLTVGTTTFECGAKVARHLKGSLDIAVFAATLGSDFDAWSQAWFQKDPLNGYIANTLGSVCVEHIVDKLELAITERAAEDNLKVSNRLSPGYCHWDVAEQKKLFSLLPDRCCNITLTDSCLMIPIKSVTGIMGLGPNLQRLEYNCQLCEKPDCIMRKGQLPSDTLSEF
ncbi:MAG: methionine synthase [Phycisphaerae bacterium]|nr:methionine synthase [Phycisphaerae bacterium]